MSVMGLFFWEMLLILLKSENKMPMFYLLIFIKLLIALITYLKKSLETKWFFRYIL